MASQPQRHDSFDQQLVLVLSSAVRASPSDAVEAILSADSFARELNKPGPLGSSALHLATWRNHAGIVRAVLDVRDVDLDVQDEESGWTALHRALYFGHVRVSSLLMRAGAKDTVRDHRGRRAVDLVSKALVRSQRVSERERDDQAEVYCSHGHVFSWGNGSNYTLGTGSSEVELAPSRVDALHMHDVVRVGAAKFHSAVVTADGKLFTWGWGRGGRLGHPEPSIHSGSSAVIYPRLVESLAMGRKVVKELAVAKHHTLLTTTDGELFSMGGNRYGQLGHGKETAAAKSVTEAKKVAALRTSYVVKIAAANKHSVAVTSTGEVYTWGSNTCGQLGYGAFDSTSSPTPRVVDALKGKRVVACAAAKRHTVVLTADGDVLTWGHRGVSPRKVNLNSVRKSSSLDGTPLRFQKGHKDVLKPRVERICAGAAHTSVLTTAGVVLTWRSADPQCLVQEIGGLLAGERVIDISAGKYRTAAVTDIGTVYMWEGRADYNPTEGRLAGSGSKKGRGIAGGMQLLGSSIDSMSSYDGSHFGSSPGSFSHRYGSPSVLERTNSRFKSVNASGGASSMALQLGPTGPACSPSPSGGSAHSLKGSHLNQYFGQQHQHQQQTFERISPVVVDGLRRVTHVAVGEKHSVALQSWMRSGDDYFSSELAADEIEVASCPYTLGPSSLQVQCEETIAKHMVDPHTVLQVMMYAEAAGADMLYRRCCCVAALNLDIVITEHPQIFAEMPPNLLRDIEVELGRVMARGSNVSSNPKTKDVEDVVFLTPTCYGNLRKRRPSRAGRVLGDAEVLMEAAGPIEGTGSMEGVDIMRTSEQSVEMLETGSSPVSSIHDASPGTVDDTDASEELRKLKRLILKKLEQINALDKKSRGGVTLDFQQAAKLGQKGVVMSALAALEGGVPHEEVNALLRAASQAVVESQQRLKVIVDVSESRESKEASSHDGAGRKVASSSTKPGKSKRKSSKKKENKEELNRNDANMEAATKSLRQLRIREEPPPARAPLSGATCMPPKTGRATNSSPPYTSKKNTSLCIVGFSPLDHDHGAVVGNGVRHTVPSTSAPVSSSSKTLQTHSPIKTVGFRPSIDGGHGRPDGLSGAVPRGPSFSSLPAGLTGSAGAACSSQASKQPIGSKAPPQTRKGGLTMFLRGELDAGANGSASGSAKPVWGAPGKLETPVSPLSKWFTDNGRPPKPHRDELAPSSASSKQTLGRIHSSGGSASKPKKVSLASFMGAKVSADGRMEAASPMAWSSEKASPSSSKPIKSLQTIQDEQEELRAATRRITFARSPPSFAKTLGADMAHVTSFHSHSLGHSPHSAGTGFLYGTSPHSSGKMFVASGPSESRWYISEEQSIEAAKAKSLKDIQAEESAAKEIADIERAFSEMERAAQSSSRGSKGRHPRGRSRRPKKPI